MGAIKMVTRDSGESGPTERRHFSMGKIKRVLTRRLIVLAVVALLVCGGSVAAANPASATATTWIAVTNGILYNTTYGSGTHVTGIEAAREKVLPGSICNYAAWFFFILPGGKVYGISWQQRAGCVYNEAWFKIGLNYYVPSGTLSCVKWYENDYATFIGQRCTGVTA
jgi:hypothetical protein